MVVKYGTSGAEKSLLGIARDKGFQASSIYDIDRARDDIERDYSAGISHIEEQIKSDVECISAKITDREAQIQTLSVSVLKDIDTEIAGLKTEIESLGNVRFGLTNIRTYIASRLTRSAKSKRHTYLVNSRKKELELRLRPHYKELETLKAEKEYLKNGAETEMMRQFPELFRQRCHINNITKMNEYAGAIGELRVIKQLETLSDDYYLFNDVVLDMNHWIKYDGKPLKSAQIDHIVVGPSGIYIIETKNWSNECVQKKTETAAFSPYEQVKRASYLLYRYLGHTRNVSIIVSIGSDIPPRHEKFVTVLRLNQLVPYIMNGRHGSIPKADIETITQRLCEKTQTVLR